MRPLCGCDIQTDIAIESSETINLTLSAPTNATLGAPNPATLTIIDDESPPPVGDELYTYDLISNITSKTGVGAYSYSVAQANDTRRNNAPKERPMPRIPPVLLLLLAGTLAGGIAPRVQAASTTTLLSGPHVGSFETTLDGAFAVFHRSQSYAGPTQVYSVPIGGGADPAEPTWRVRRATVRVSSAML